MISVSYPLRKLLREIDIVGIIQKVNSVLLMEGIVRKSRKWKEY